MICYTFAVLQRGMVQTIIFPTKPLSVLKCQQNTRLIQLKTHTSMFVFSLDINKIMDMKYRPVLKILIS